MNRQEHRREAESLLESVASGAGMLSDDSSDRVGDDLLLRVLDLDVARAQVHALLAAAPDGPPTPDVE